MSSRKEKKQNQQKKAEQAKADQTAGETKEPKKFSSWIPLGATLGLAFGYTAGHWFIGLVIGLAFGIGYDVLLHRADKKHDEEAAKIGRAHV